MPRVLIAALMLVGAPAMAATPSDVDLGALAYWNGISVDTESIRTNAYHRVVRELGAAIANKPMAPGDTLGAYGFEVLVSSTVGFISGVGGSVPSAWERVQSDGQASPSLWIPRISIRKGLPASLDIGASMGLISSSRQTVFGAYGRWSPLEGYRQAPDLALQLGYSGYVGNDQLEAGAMDLSATTGYTFRFGRVLGVNHATFTPYAGIGSIRVHARPRLTVDEQLELGVGAVSGFKKDQGTGIYDESFSPFQTHLGFRLVSSSFQLVISGTMASKVLPTLNVGLGFSY